LRSDDYDLRLPGGGGLRHDSPYALASGADMPEARTGTFCHRSRTTNDSLGGLVVIGAADAGAIGDMHSAAADEGTATRTGTQFRQGHSYRHAATLSLPARKNARRTPIH
jgi:hypothetical protein